MYSLLAQQPKRRTNFILFICVTIISLFCVWNYTRLDRCYCLPTASRYPDGSRVSARTSLYSMSRFRHCQGNWDAGHSTANLNHSFMIASFREWLGSKLAAHWHHGRIPAASFLLSSLCKRKVFHHGSNSASTAEMFWGML